MVIIKHEALLCYQLEFVIIWAELQYPQILEIFT